MRVHDQPDLDEILESFVRGRLTGDEQRWLEEHLIGCGECFGKTQELERFLAGVRYAAASGQLAARPPRRSFWIPALAFASWALLVMSGFWIGNLRSSLEQSNRARRALEQAQSQAGAQSAIRRMPASNLPMAILQANRSGAPGTEVAVPAASEEIALWIQMGQNSSAQRFTVEIYSAPGVKIAGIVGLQTNRYSALSVAVPARSLPAGLYTVKVLRDSGELAAQYGLKITITKQ